ncbi:hypothetical protein Droror1_Dr00021691 [Drosera rotundifolia]
MFPGSIYMPFGSWRENEVDTFAKIAKGQFDLSKILSPESVDLITKLLQVDETERLGSQGADSVKSHPWLDGVDWEAISNGTAPVPSEILPGTTHHVEALTEDSSIPLPCHSQAIRDHDTFEWLEDW